jgi:hypothetical protein
VKTLITQPTKISHSKTKPASAPTFVVAISSPEPTMEPAMISPGPSRRTTAKNPRGGSTVGGFIETPPAPARGH